MDILGLHPTKTVGFNCLSFKLGNYVFLVLEGGGQSTILY